MKGKVTNKVTILAAHIVHYEANGKSINLFLFDKTQSNGESQHTEPSITPLHDQNIRSALSRGFGVTPWPHALWTCSRWGTPGLSTEHSSLLSTSPSGSSFTFHLLQKTRIQARITVAPWTFCIPELQCHSHRTKHFTWQPTPTAS